MALRVGIVVLTARNALLRAFGPDMVGLPSTRCGSRSRGRRCGRWCSPPASGSRSHRCSSWAWRLRRCGRPSSDCASRGRVSRARSRRQRPPVDHGGHGSRERARSGHAHRGADARARRDAARRHADVDVPHRARHPLPVAGSSPVLGAQIPAGVAQGVREGSPDASAAASDAVAVPRSPGATSGAPEASARCTSISPRASAAAPASLPRASATVRPPPGRRRRRDGSGDMTWSPSKEADRLRDRRGPAHARPLRHRGAGSPRQWDERRGYGVSGATLVSRGSARDLRDEASPLLGRRLAGWGVPSDRRTRPGRRARAVARHRAPAPRAGGHPLGGRRGRPGAVQTGDGEWTVEIRWREFPARRSPPRP